MNAHQRDLLDQQLQANLLKNQQKLELMEQKYAVEQQAKAIAQIEEEAMPLLVAQVRQHPSRPLVLAQIQRAVLMAELARRKLAAHQQDGPVPVEALLERVSAAPMAKWLQDRLENHLDAAECTPPKPTARL